MKVRKKGMLYWLVFAGLAFIIYESTTQPTNNADKFFQEYFEKIRPFSAVINYPRDIAIEDQMDFTSYKRGFSILGYKALLGDIDNLCVQDTVTKKYFKIYQFDNKKHNLIYVDKLLGRKIRVYLYANSDDLANPEYGTRERPIPVFSYKGMDEPIAVTSQSREAIDGMESLEPTQAEFEHNVRCYLTYVMSKEEFNARFKNSKK